MRKSAVLLLCALSRWIGRAATVAGTRDEGEAVIDDTSAAHGLRRHRSAPSDEKPLLIYSQTGFVNMYMYSNYSLCEYHDWEMLQLLQWRTPMILL